METGGQLDHSGLMVMAIVITISERVIYSHFLKPARSRPYWAGVKVEWKRRAALLANVAKGT
jgi:hypothetical protein